MNTNRFDAWTRRRFGRAAGGMTALLLGMGALDSAIAKKRKGGKQKDKGNGKGKGKGKHRCQDDGDCPKNQSCALDTGRCTSACDEAEPAPLVCPDCQVLACHSTGYECVANPAKNGQACTFGTVKCGTCQSGACAYTCGKCETCDANGTCFPDVLKNGEQCNGSGHCDGGQCCQSFQINCGGECVDSLSDPNHCGGCGFDCTTQAGDACLAGVCDCANGGERCCVNGGQPCSPMMRGACCYPGYVCDGLGTCWPPQ